MAGDIYAGMSDTDVLERARQLCIKAASLKPGTIERELAWLAFDGAMAELDRRRTAIIRAYLERPQ